MFTNKRALISLALVALLVGCGGGGGDDAGTSTSAPPPAGTGTSAPPQVDPPPVVVDNTVMTGRLILASNELQFNGIGVTTAQFVDATTTPKGAFFGKGTNGPLNTFGFRVYPEDMAVAGGQTKRARMAVDIKDSAAAGTQHLQLMIDQVDLSVSATNVLTVSVPTTAKLYIYASNAAGQTTDIVVSNLPANLVRLTPITGDSTSDGLTLDIDTAIASALVAAQGTPKLAILNSLKDFAGEFIMKVTLSNVEIRNAAGTTPLVGAPITVTGSGQPAVTGAGVTGFLTIS